MEEKLIWKVSRAELKKIYRMFDKLTGTVEPSYRVLHFFYHGGLKIFGTDGTAKLLYLTGSFPPFNGIYSIPLNDLKVILHGRSDEEINFEFSGRNVNIFTESEFLQVRNTQRSDLPFHISEHFEIFSYTSLNTFRDALDFSSVVLEEPENTCFVIFNNVLYTAGISHNIACVAKVEEARVDRMLLGEVPYVTARHLVKSLGEVKQCEELAVGFNGDELSLNCNGVVYHVSVEPHIPRALPGLLRSLPDEVEEERDLREFHAVLKKVYTFHPRGTVRITQARDSKNQWQISVQVAAGLYVSRMEALGRLEGTLTVEVHRLRSALMRLGNKARVSSVNRSLVFSSRSKYLFLAAR